MNRIVYLLLLITYSIGVAQEGGGAINLSLKEAIKIATEKNPAVSRARFAVDAAYGRKLSGMSPAQPVMSLTYEEIPLAGGGIGSYGERTFSISQGIEFPTTTYMRGQYLSSLAGSAEWEYKSAINDVISDVKESYTNYLIISEKAGLAKENLEIATEFARKAELKMNAGEGTNLEKLTAKVQQSQAETALKTAQKELEAACNGIAALLGTEQRYIITDTLEYREVRQSLEELMALAEKNNPGLKSAGSSVDAAEYNHKMAVSSYLPGFEIAYYNQSLSGVNNYYGFSVGVSIPLWFMFDQRGRVNEAEAGYDYARMDLVDKKNNLIKDVKNTYLELKDEERQVESYKTELLPGSEEIYRTALLSYEAGEIGYLELLQAKQTLVQAKEGYIEALERYYKALNLLERLTGI